MPPLCGRERAALWGILALGALLRLWDLAALAPGRSYYAAAAFSQAQSWHNFFFNAFDPGGFVSVDKPPLGIWVQVLGGALFGFDGLGVLLPQAVMGLASVLLLHAMLRPRLGPGPALGAALLLALTPAAIAVDRSNNMESLLTLLLLLAAWAGLRAAEEGRRGPFLIAMALVGLGFNVKMGAALPLAAPIALAFLLAFPGRPWRRLLSLAGGGAVLAAVALAWPLAYDLTPPDKRPWVGGSRSNRMLELVVQHNGWARFLRPEGQAAAAEGQVAPARPALWDDSPTGPLRLLRPHQAAQVMWWLPLALFGLAALRRQRAMLLILGGWVLLYGAAFSFAGGVFHTYYLAVLAPPLAALAAAGGAWLLRREGGWLAAGLAGLGLWQGHILLGQAGADPAQPALQAGLFALGLALLLLLARAVWRIPPALLLIPALILPAAAAASLVLRRPNPATPAADLARLGRPAEDAERAAAAARAALWRERLLALLDAQAAPERFVLAVPNALIAAPLILASGRPVIAYGGYAGTDPILTPARLCALVRDGALRFVMTGGFALTPRQAEVQGELWAWIRRHGEQLPLARGRWPPRRGAAAEAEPAELWDLRPLREKGCGTDAPPALAVERS
ncbi:MAG: glycosyltransferase family 39 protein [Rhodovarius sp.]|nr:glycosyltransferase family 39 protein [Rhodovarius sp.]